MVLARVAVAIGVVWMLASGTAIAQTPLASALDLYAAASYDEALAALDEARRGQPSVDDLVTIDRHRLLCLVALGRTGAAQEVVAGLLDARPDFVLAAAEVSPRVRAVFDAARAKALPDLVRRRYAEARRAFDAGRFDTAHQEFAQVVALLGDPVVAQDPSSADLHVVANGFLELSAASLERARAKTDHAPVAIAARAVEVSSPPPFSGAPAPGPIPTPAPAAIESPPFAPMDIFTYDWRDADVTPPVPVSQAVSGWWSAMREPAPGTQLGAIEVEVDESGAVTDARIYLSVNRVYDRVLLESAKQWRYTPATRGGRPVKYRRITAVVSGR